MKAMIGEKRKTVIFVVALMISACGIFLGSCKKKTEVKTPRRFNFEVDGIAVRELPVIDYKLAQRIVREGPVSAIDDATVKSILPARAGNSAATEEKSSSGSAGG